MSWQVIFGEEAAKAAATLPPEGREELLDLIAHVTQNPWLPAPMPEHKGTGVRVAYTSHAWKAYTIDVANLWIKVADIGWTGD